MTFSSIKQINTSIIGFKIGLASPFIIAKWSWRKIANIIFSGKVSEPYTINYKTKLPELNGLFCEKIFGPIFSWKCKCGFLSVQRPVICQICGSENNNCLLRRFRMGSVYLQVPIAHFWYIETLLPIFLEISPTLLIILLYYKIFFTKLKKLNKQNILYLKKFTLTQALFFSNYIKKILLTINLIKEILKVRLYLNEKNFTSHKKFFQKKINYLSLFILSSNHPNWILLDIIPIIPVGLRPFIQIGEKSFVTSPINEIYKNIIIKNNKLKKWKALRRSVPIIFELLEKRNLQKAVDLLLNCHKINNKTNLIFPIQGKQGHFRQYILGKRVDFSARSVIIPGPDLKIKQVGISINLSFELFKPIFLKILKQNIYLRTFFKLSLLVETKSIVLKRLLNIFLKKQSLLLNRAPTLHKMNIQTFKPYLIESETIKIFPLACSSFNADFDGDQMGLFMPLSNSAQIESKRLSTLDKNIFSYSIFKSNLKLSQNIVLGLNYLLTIVHSKINSLIFSNINDSLKVFNHNLILLPTIILIRINDNILNKCKKRYLITSIGRLVLQNL